MLTKKQTVVDIWQWAMYHSPENVSRPEEFIPERWLEDLEFSHDNKDAFQPFSYGARNCLGRQ